MATLFCKWPAGQRLAAEAYNARCAVEYETVTGEIEAIWAVVREDAHGNWTVPFLGAPWFYAVEGDFKEPLSNAALRADAVVVAMPEWPIVSE